MNRLFDRWYFLSSGMKWFLLVIGLIISLLAFVVYNLATDQKGIRDVRCLALNIYHEARGESQEGQLAVATVTMNRIDSLRYPDNVCDVVRQYGWNPKLQKHISAFSWTGDQLTDAPADSDSWQRAVTLARRVLDGERHPELSSALFYHANYIMPGWAKKKKRIATIGQHMFYP